MELVSRSYGRVELDVFNTENYSFPSVHKAFFDALDERTGEGKQFSKKEADWIVEMYNKALLFHAGYLRHEKTISGLVIPYFVHPAGAALRAMMNGESAILVVALLFHDTIEDTDFGKLSSAEMLEICRNKIVIDIVQLLTNKVKDRKLSNDEYYSQIYGMVKSLKCKAYDIEDNLDSFLRMMLKKELHDCNRTKDYIDTAQEWILPKLKTLKKNQRINKIIVQIRTIITEIEHLTPCQVAC